MPGVGEGWRAGAGCCPSCPAHARGVPASPTPCPRHLRTGQLLPTHLLVRDLQQIQHHFVGIHVLQKALLLLAHLLSNPTHLIQPLQDLGREGPWQRGTEPGSPSGWPPALGACLQSRCALHKPRCSLHLSQILAPPSEILRAVPCREPVDHHQPSPLQSPQCKAHSRALGT